MCVSVIIPAYNCAPYLPSAINSVLAQSHGDLEIIVVDDGSTDDTGAALRPWDGRVRCIRQNNQGVAAARNTGLRHASGEYVAFLDADDAWYSEKLAIQLSILTARPDLLAVCAEFGLADERGTVVEQRYIKKKYRVFSAYALDWERIFANRLQVPAPGGSAPSGTMIDVHYGNAFAALFLGNFINTSSIVLRRRAIESVGQFTTQRRTQEDYEYWLKVALLGPIAYVDHPLLMFRRRPRQLTAADQRYVVAEDSLRVVQDVAPLARARLPERIVACRLADRLRELGSARLSANDHAGARKALGQAWAQEGFHTRTAGLYLWSFLPVGFSDFIRRAYRWVRARGPVVDAVTPEISRR